MSQDRNPDARTWKVGPLAARLGTTVRALHHYEQLGLVSPDRDPESGHRIYGPRQVERLGKVRLLCGLGLSLEEIGRLLEPSEVPLSDVLRLHKERLKNQMGQIRDLIDRLEGLETWAVSDPGRTTDGLLSLMETMMNFEKHYTEEQLAELARRREQLGEEGMRKGQQDWQELIAEVRAAVEAGTPPDGPKGRELAGRWEALIEAFTGGDPGIRASLANAYRAQPGAMEQFGIDRSMQEWVGKASRR